MRTASLTLVLIPLALLGCGRAPPSGTTAPARSVGYPHVALPEAPARDGIAVVVLLDTSGSMAGKVLDPSKKLRPKADIARDALQRVVKLTADWKAKHPDTVLQFGIYRFAGDVGPILPVGDFDAKKAEAALAKPPRSSGSTSIGSAMEQGFRALYDTGCRRKYLVCITDGDNTSGPSPAAVGRQLQEQTEGRVQMHFIAFDLDRRSLGFVDEIKGHAHEAKDGEKLQSTLQQIYEKRILAEVEEPLP
jgi:hypothetical protein